MYVIVLMISCVGFFFFFSSRRRHTRGALVTGVQTCALPICVADHDPDELVGIENLACRSVELPDREPTEAPRQRRIIIVRPVVQLDILHRAEHVARGFEASGKLANRSRHGAIELGPGDRSEEHTSELQSLMRISYAAFCL